MQGLQGDLPTLFVVIIAAAAFLAGLCGERLRAQLACHPHTATSAPKNRVSRFAVVIADFCNKICH
jgi:hypothetical protein